MARVVVIGTSCAGKTTFARALARILTFPHIELDALHWLPNWTENQSMSFARSQPGRSHKTAGSSTATIQLISHGRGPQL